MVVKVDAGPVYLTELRGVAWSCVVRVSGGKLDVRKADSGVEHGGDDGVPTKGCLRVVEAPAFSAGERSRRVAVHEAKARLSTPTPQTERTSPISRR